MKGACVRRYSGWLLVLMGMALQAHGAPVAGRDYTELNPARPTSDPTRVVVTEFFSYGCPHCAAFSRPLAAWVKALPPGVVVERVPTSLGHAQWEPLARTYLALLAMKSVDRLDDALFTAIHQQGLQLYTEAALTTWVAAHGIDGKAFGAMYHSFGLDAQYRAAEAKARDLQIPSIPTLVIDGRYMVAIEDRGGSFRDQLGVVGELVARAMQAHRQPASVPKAPAAANHP